MHTPHSKSIRPGFTLIELLVVISIIVLLISLAVVGLVHVRSTAKQIISQQTVQSLGMSIKEFRSSNGFLPPLIRDGDYMDVGGNGSRPIAFKGKSKGPVYVFRPQGLTREIGLPVAYSEGAELEFFRRPYGSTGAAGGGLPRPSMKGNNSWRDPRYSKYSLAYYMGGVLPAFVDGYDGPDMAAPERSGRFTGLLTGSVGQPREALIELTGRMLKTQSQYYDPIEYREQGATASRPDGKEEFNTVLVDENGKAFRYYRWEPQATVRRPVDYNIPAVLIDPLRWLDLHDQGYNLVDGQDNEDVDVTATDQYPGGRPELRGATYAIVGAGPDGLFGTEEIADIADAFGVAVPGAGDTVRRAELRRRAWEDNVAEVGR